MFHMVFVCSSCHRMSQDELVRLLKQNQEQNQKMNITGMLLYDDGNILQVIEGEQHDVEALYHKLEKDVDQTGHIVILQEEIKRRTFSDWSMAFKQLTQKGLEKLSGYSEFLEKEFNPAFSDQKSREVMSLLCQFRAVV